MKLSKLIKELEKAKTKHGDIECTVQEASDAGECKFVPLFLCFREENDGKISQVSFVDYETAHAFD